MQLSTSQLINVNFPGGLEQALLCFKASQSDQIWLLFAYLSIICEQYELDTL